MVAENLLGGLLGLALFAFAGRVLLSFLPPGEPGFHRPAQLPATWAASHLLGVLAFHALLVVLSPFPINLSVEGFVAPFAILAVVRWIALPGAMVPRAQDRPERPSPAARVVLALVVLALVALPFAAAGDSIDARADSKLTELHAFGARTPLQMGVLHLLGPASLAALVILLLHGLRCAGATPLVRRLAVAIFLSTPALWHADVIAGDDGVLLLLFGSGCAHLIAWMRRADPRAMALAAISFGACPAYRPEALPLAAAGLAVLIIGTHANARGWVVRWVCGALLLLFPPWHVVRWVALPLWHTALVEQPGELMLDASRIGIEALGATFARFGSWGASWALAAVAALLGVARGLRSLLSGGASTATRELPALLAVTLLAIAFQLPMLVLQDVAADVEYVSWGDALLHALPATALLIALVARARGGGAS